MTNNLGRSTARKKTFMKPGSRRREEKRDTQDNAVCSCAITRVSPLKRCRCRCKSTSSRESIPSTSAPPCTCTSFSSRGCIAKYVNITPLLSLYMMCTCWWLSSNFTTRTISKTITLTSFCLCAQQPFQFLLTNCLLHPSLLLLSKPPI